MGGRAARAWMTGAIALAALVVGCATPPAGPSGTTSSTTTSEAPTTEPTTTTTESTTTTTESTTTTTTSTTTTTTVPGPQRYLDPVFAAATRTNNVAYGTAVNNLGQTVTLRLDVYRPTGDTVTNRPAIVWIHGGGFVEGDKAQDSAFATELARTGYVVVSINYRLEQSPAWNPYGDPFALATDPGWLAAVMRAYEDSRTAVQFLRTNASTYGVDPGRISVAGASAGGITALNTMFVPDRTTGDGGPTDPRRVAAAVSIVGTTLPEWIQAGEGPVLMLNGTLDTLVPPALYQPVCPAAQALGVTCVLREYPADHVGIGTHVSDLRTEILQFLHDEVITP